MNPQRPLSTITAYRLVALLILAISIYSCANMSRPGGGPRDETPPVFIKGVPAPGALNVSKQEIEIEFDEIIQVEKPSEKVIVSPPQKDMPEIRTSGRKVTVTLRDSLLPNTTYTLDFSDAIVESVSKTATLSRALLDVNSALILSYAHFLTHFLTIITSFVS